MKKAIFKRFTAVLCAAMCTIGTSALNASARSAVSVLSDAGQSTNIQSGITWYFKNNAEITTEVLSNNQMSAYGTVNIFEKTGLYIPTSIHINLYADLYDEYGLLLRSGIGSNDQEARKISVSTPSYTGSKSAKYYCKGVTRVNLTDYPTTQTITMGA